MALNSMTGFARDSAEFAHWSWSWELKSVNAKGLDVRPRVPSGLDAVETEVRARTGKAFSRGNITVGLALNRQSGEVGYRINNDHLERMIAIASDLAQRLPDARPASIDGLLALRGVIETEEEDADDDAKKDLERALLTSFDAAIKALASARAEEGARLEVVLSGFMATLADLQAQATKTAEAQGDAIRQRLLEQITTLMADASGLDAGRLEQELSIVMSKADIREELDRLHAHIASVSEMMTEGGAIGRRLDFLCQELNREANTICSKAHDTDLTRIGLEMKATIEQFREQVQNIE